MRLLLLPLIFGLFMIPAAFGYSDDLDIFVLGFEDVPYTCPGEYTNSQLTLMNLHSFNQFNYLIYSGQNNDPSKELAYVTTRNAPSHGYNIFVLEADVSPYGRSVSATFALIDITERHSIHCVDSPPLLIVDFYAKCDGSLMSMISRNNAGFNLTSTNYEIGCVP